MITTLMLALTLAAAPALADDGPTPDAKTQDARKPEERRQRRVRRRVLQRAAWWSVSPHGQRPSAVGPPMTGRAMVEPPPGERGCGLR
jgi:hypothetical protein